MTQYVPRQRRHNIYITYTTKQMSEEMFLPVSPSLLSSQSGWVDEAALDIIPFIAVFKLGNERKSASAK
jgi:hypothetical protein